MVKGFTNMTGRPRIEINMRLVRKPPANPFDLHSITSASLSTETHLTPSSPTPIFTLMSVDSDAFERANKARSSSACMAPDAWLSTRTLQKCSYCAFLMERAALKYSLSSMKQRTIFASFVMVHISVASIRKQYCTGRVRNVGKLGSANSFVWWRTRTQKWHDVPAIVERSHATQRARVLVPTL